MRKFFWISLLLLLLLGTACSSGDEEQSSTNSDTSTNDTEDNADEANDTNNSGNDNNAENEDTDSGENDDGDDDSEFGEDEEANEEDEDETEEAPEYKIDEESSSVVPIDDSADEDVVLLTIDDAPDDHAVEMAHTLKDLDVNAIFFVNGHFLETDEEKEALKEIHDMGFLIGNHTYSHPNLSEIPEDEQREEIVEVSDMIEEVIDERPAFFRAPHGVNTDTSKEVIDEEDMTLMNWTYGFDYFEEYEDKEKLTEAMISGEAPEIGENNSLLRPGANLLMHDREWTNEALEDIVTGLRDKDYEMVDPALIETEK